MRRNNEAFLDAIGAQRIPDPTTAGDFTRRFEKHDIELLMDSINNAREKVWSKAPRGFMKEALIDVDGTLSETLVSAHAKEIMVRGDTDFSLTRHFDRWSEGVDFVFGMDACASFVTRAQALGEASWEPFARAPKYEVRTWGREKPERVKEQIVVEWRFKNIRLNSEQVAEFDYRPTKCKKTYRMVVLRKNLSVEKGEMVLFDDIRYFFYITTRRDLTAAEVVEQANKRCNQENVIAQLKNGVNAMRMPVQDLESNWAYMVMTALAWNLKAWFGLLMPMLVIQQ